MANSPNTSIRGALDELRPEHYGVAEPFNSCVARFSGSMRASVQTTANEHKWIRITRTAGLRQRDDRAACPTVFPHRLIRAPRKSIVP